MADIPVQRSYQQILSSMIDAFCAEKGIRNLRAGGSILCSLEAAARSDLRSNQDIFAMLASVDLDKARGLALDRIGQGEDAPRLFQKASTGKVLVTDTRYKKVSTKFSTAMPVPIVGATRLYVQDASDFGISGVLYIGRGTTNYEGPLTFNACSDQGSYWEITLSTPTTKYHAPSEVLLLGQGGNRTIGAGQKVSTPVAALSDSISFSLVKSVKLPDGEVEVAGVEVVCTAPGTVGNISAGAIQGFVNQPFTGAAVTNPLPFSNGRETEDDDSYRERIRTIRKTRAKAIVLAIKNAVLGLTAEDSSSSITSASIISKASGTTLYIDDGTGYEETSQGVPVEILIDAAAGGEQIFELQHRPVAKACVTSVNSAPFDLSGGKTLDVKVGGVSYSHVFTDSDAINSKSASAYEAATSINGNVILPFAARTADGGTRLVITARSNENEDIEVLGGTANTSFGFPAGRVYSVRLYKNDRLLTKDGSLARFLSQPFNQWSAPTPVVGAVTIEVAVDRTPSVLYSITDQDFVDGQTGFNAIGLNSLQAWATVLNNHIPGVTVTVEGDQLVVTSNLGRNNNACVAIAGGSLVNCGMFNAGSVQGATRDYILARNTSTIELAVPLSAGDQLSIGTNNSQAFLQSKSLVPTTYNQLKLWLSVDGSEQVVAHGVTPASPLSITTGFGCLHSWGYEQVISCTGAFSNVQPGDWLTLTDPVLPTTCQGTFKVGKVSPTGDWVTIERTSFNNARVGHAVVVLKNSSGLSPVLIIGGGLTTGSGITLQHLPEGARYSVGSITSSCEVYDPATGTVTPTASMMTPRAFHSATLLASGLVMVAGGYDAAGNVLDSTEIYDPVAGTWTVGPRMSEARVGHQATWRNDSRVMMTGGYNGTAPTASCDVYNPTNNTLTTTNSMSTARMNHQAVVLGDGSVFIVGGMSADFTELATTELYNVILRTWGSRASMNTARGLPAIAYESASNRVLALGCATPSIGDPLNWEAYDVASNTWSAPASISFPGMVTDNPAMVQAHLVVDGSGNVVCPNMLAYTEARRLCASWTSAGGWVARAMDNLYTEAVAIYGSKSVCLTQNDVKTGRVLVVGGYDLVNQRPTAVIEQYENSAWTFPGRVSVSNSLLTSRGVSFTRTNSVPQLLDFTPAARVYSGTMLADSLNGLVAGTTIKPWHTTYLRVSTNSYNGSLLVMGANQAASALGFPSTVATSGMSNVAVVSSLSALETTPSFKSVTLFGKAKPSMGVEAYEISGIYSLDYNMLLRKAKPLTRAFGEYPFTTVWDSRTGNQEGVLFTPMTAAATGLLKIETRSSIQRMLPGETAVGLRSYAIGPQDDLTVEVDGDSSKRFTTRLYRKLKPVDASYTQSVQVLDAETGASLVNTIGATSDLSDMAVYMRARGVLFDDHNDRKLLARFYRFGAEGEGVNLAFDNPVSESQPTKYAGRMIVNSKLVERFLLASGARRTNPFTAGQRFLIGLNTRNRPVVYTGLTATTAARATNVVTITCSLPTDMAAHGFHVGDNVYVSTGDVAFPDGTFTITAKTDTTISYSQTGADVGAAAITGYVSCNSSETRLDNKGIVVDDFCYFNEVRCTMRVIEVARRFVVLSLGYLHSISTLITGNVADNDTIQFWANPKKTAAQVLSDFSAMSAELKAKCPVNFTSLEGGTGLVYLCTADELLSPTAFYTLADGINWVASSSVIDSTIDHYQITFKKAITPALASASDWQNEELRLVPVTVKTLVRWFNTPAFSGLFSDVQVREANNRLQFASTANGSASTIQVQGGTANEVVATMFGPNLVRSSAITGLTGGAWVKLQNEFALPKSIVPTTGGLDIIDTNGYVLTSFDTYSSFFSPQTVPVTVEKVGNFVAVRSLTYLNVTGFDGHILRLSVPTEAPANGLVNVSIANTGCFQIVRVENDGTFWIEAPNAVEELANAVVEVFEKERTVLPGDKIYLNSPAIPAANRGVWTVETVGASPTGSPFRHQHYLKLSTASRIPVPCSAISVGAGVYIEEAEASHQFLKVMKIVPSFENSDFSELTFDLASQGVAGTVLTVCDKLGFNTSLVSGHDGYQYSTGLVGEANKAVYGDPEDQASYPGEVAAGIQLDISTGYVRRIKVALVVRTVSGATRADLAGRVKSAVAAVINRSGLGQSISIGEMIKAAQGVPGVVSVAWVSPAYTATTDMIPVQGHEKPMVLDLDTDVQVTFAGE